MIVSIHQPVFLPYLGFFRKIALSDVFVIYNTAQYTKNDWHNRNRILTSQGVEWLTIPVQCHLGDTFTKCKISENNFTKKQLKKITFAYQNTPFFNQYFPILKKMYENTSLPLDEYNTQFIIWILEILKIPTKIIYSSEISDIGQKKSTDALIKITQHLKGSTYLSGGDGPNYLDVVKFEQVHIKLIINEFTPYPYPQEWTKEFIPYLSTLDALMNIGAENTRKLLGI